MSTPNAKTSGGVDGEKIDAGEEQNVHTLSILRDHLSRSMCLLYTNLTTVLNSWKDNDQPRITQ
jgi:hypothetical protein